jgi:hypothetical protein
MRACKARTHAYILRSLYPERRGLALQYIIPYLGAELLTPSRCQTLTRFLELIQAESVARLDIYYKYSRRARSIKSGQQ